MATNSTFIGSLSAFDPDQESISSYMERVQIFFTANSVEEDKQVPVFLSVVGANTYTLLRTLLAPAKPSTKSLADLTTALVEYYEPKPLVIAQRFHFHRRNQEPSESIAEYVAALRKLSTFCEFGAQLDDALRDRLVCGVHSEPLQKYLLSVKDLTFQAALDKALSMEAAEHNTQELHAKNPSTQSVPVHKVDKQLKRTPPQPRSSAPAVVHFSLPQSSFQKGQQPPSSHKGLNTKGCYRCGKTGHLAHQCCFLESTCHSCGKKGHIAPVCRSKPRPTARAHVISSVLKNHLPPDQELHLFHVGSAPKSAPPITVQLGINSVPVSMEVDTGAEVSVMSEEVFSKLFPKQELNSSRSQLQSYTDGRIPVCGETTVQVQYQAQSARLPIIVVKGDQPSLLGRNWLQHLKLDWKSNAAVSRVQPLSPGGLIQRYPKVFEGGLGTFTGGAAKIQICEGANARFHKSRPVPFAIKEAVGKELDRLEAEGIIEKVTTSDWAAPIVAVPKRDGTYRLCGDCKVTTSPILEVAQYPLPNPTDLFASLAGGKSFTKLDLTQAYQQLLLDQDSKKYTTINTHKGLYQYTRLPFGIASAQPYFKRQWTLSSREFCTYVVTLMTS